MIPVLILVAIICAAGVWLHRQRHHRDRVWWIAWTVPVSAVVIILILIATDFYLQKVLGRLLMPAGLVWCVLLLTTALCFLRRLWGQGLVTMGLTILYTLAGNIWLGNAITAQLEAMVTPIDSAHAGPFDAIAVLGGGTDLDPRGRPQFGNTGERVALAARLFHAGRAPILVATGIGIDDHPRSLAEETRQLWLGLGIPDTSIVMLDKGRITREEISAIQALCNERGWQRIGLVSSAWHLPRALVHCGALGFSVTPLPCDWRGTSDPLWFYNLIPHQDGFQKVHIGCWEWLGRWAGR